jgi:uncharacterized membrane protein YfcA
VRGWDRDGAVTWADAPFLAIAGFAAGLTGTVAGLASLVSYPALLAVGLAPVAANVTNTVALTATGIGAAAGSRPELAGARSNLRRLVPVAAAGAACGAVLLLLTPGDTFEIVVPFLVGGASLALLLQPATRRWSERHRLHAVRGAVPLGMFAIAIYAGYFGAAAGVLLLALLSATVEESLPRANALKNVLLGASNAAASIGFVLFGPVHWPAVLPMALGLLAGGWTGPAVARLVPSTALRIAIAIAGLALALKLFLDTT